MQAWPDRNTGGAQVIAQSSNEIGAGTVKVGGGKLGGGAQGLFIIHTHILMIKRDLYI